MTNPPELTISYKPLWKLLIDKNLKRQDLRKMSGISGATIAKLGRNENVTTAILVKIATALNCGMSDIAEIIDTTKDGANVPTN